MIDRKSTETTWNVLSSKPHVSAVASFPRSPTKRRKRSLRQRPHQLAHDIRAICQGAQRAQADRQRTLLLCAQPLDRRKKAINLTADDIRLLVNKWQADKLAASTIRFRLVCLRWLARKIGKPDIVQSDRAYGVDRSAKCKT